MTDTSTVHEPNLEDISIDGLECGGECKEENEIEQAELIFRVDQIWKYETCVMCVVSFTLVLNLVVSITLRVIPPVAWQIRKLLKLFAFGSSISITAVPLFFTHGLIVLLLRFGVKYYKGTKRLKIAAILMVSFGLLNDSYFMGCMPTRSRYILERHKRWQGLAGKLTTTGVAEHGNVTELSVDSLPWIAEVNTHVNQSMPMLDQLEWAETNKSLRGATKKLLPQVQSVEDEIQDSEQRQEQELISEGKNEEKIRKTRLIAYVLLLVLSTSMALPPIVSRLVIPLSVILYFAAQIAGPAYYEAVHGIDAECPHVWEVAEDMFFLTSLLIFRAWRRANDQFFQVIQSEIIEEKVKRCKAEFEHAQLQQRYRGCTENTARSEFENETSRHSGYSSKLSSNRTAPAAPLVFFTGASKNEDACNCVSKEALVRVKGEPEPINVTQVKVGQQVECFDHVRRVTGYSDVKASSIIESETKWVRVVLSDGSSVVLTEDHPMRPLSEDGRNHYNDVVEAGKLTPGADFLTVIKPSSLAVQKVEEVKRSTERVALALKNPDRYSIFVSDPEGAASDESNWIAVGAANLGGLGWARGMSVKRTFISYDEDPFQRTPAFARSQSLPSLHLDSQDEVGFQCQALPGSQTASTGATMEELQDLEQEVVDASVAEFLASSNFKSIGSREHESGTCRPCVFEFRYQQSIAGAAPCRKGPLCHKCHETHEAFTRDSGAARRSMRKKKMKEEVQLREDHAALSL
eukprot:TRINITY_DN26255_c0_g1_i2.p1 TRINITY_DN26255_c0_g1~~TRINITY_DN26255_c0_g1_i2.p1  ORF type:complete len:747 (-),score=93.52 TRINITY_DN26255_c0_g1_i2:51-2291(-)